MQKIVIISIAVFFIYSCATSTMSVDVIGLDDPLEEKIKVTSYNYSKPFILAVGQADYFFRAYIDKSSRNKNIQLYVQFNSSDWIFWDRVKFDTGNGLEVFDVSRVGSDVDCSQYGCSHYEDVVFKIEKGWLESWAKTGKTLRFFSTRVSTHRDVSVTIEEAKAFLEKLSSL
jgi:hypothetical protein